MRRSAAGDSGAFSALYDRHVREVRFIARSICRDASLADDVTQEAFLSLWRSARRFDGRKGTVRSWLAGIARNRAIDSLRRTANADRVVVALRAVPLATAPATDDVCEARDERRRVRGAVARLPQPQRDVIELAFLGDLTHVEIGERSELPLGTVKGRVRLGLERLRADDTLEVA